MNDESEKRERQHESGDHRDIGQKLDLFSFHEIAPGAPFWHRNGMIIFKELESYLRAELDKTGYEEISTPIMVKKEVFERSGHWEHYRENMFYFDNPRDADEHLVIKPMNCPESTYVYNAKTRSYKDLPVRLAEIGRLHRNELSGTLGGLFRVRQLTMDDAHIYAAPAQVKKEVVSIIEMIEKFYALFGLQPSYVLATRPEKALGSQKDWDMAEKALRSALEKSGKSFAVAEGEGAFYGPKIEVHLKDSQNRDWQMGTAQLDLVMLPKQFETYYIAEDGSKKLPWVIHRAIFGSFERFIGMLLEHCGGELPLWLSPVQVAVLGISEGQAGYAKRVIKTLEKKGIRVRLFGASETLGKRIREAEMQKIPYVVVVGEKEVAGKTVSVRERGGEKDRALGLREFAREISKRIRAKQ
ncbi:MAG: threonine--tRNA ligase [Candidatus Liptonbacteria bacterium GWC1_60_9]|uniref:Threonine--tRNA ligase n=2 Tax=Candidatus Liptoniibacteriota TaxID=1817909 RepID=A0A1G2CK29_9BACT|nr:MAG: threonine--tRNA ligase [Candidatus Liptonbacteria bacterium GWC1_60_9]OGZ01763.1 MAG: threonine--tRNA ligase [Candidatus Liptonbacteria bacterium RIFCSPLOWO2_12_FULL_60_15]